MFRMIGTTDESDTCEVCGKVELKVLVRLAAIDADGNEAGELLAGTTCAARKLATTGTKTTARKLATAAQEADRLHAEARTWANEFATLNLADYLEANRRAPLTAAELTARHAATVAEATAILTTGTLTGTRWASKLPTV